MTVTDRIAAARQRVTNSIEMAATRAKADARAELRQVAEWMNRSKGQRARQAIARGGR